MPYRSTAAYNNGVLIPITRYPSSGYEVWDQEAERLMAAIDGVRKAQGLQPLDLDKTLTIGCGRRLFGNGVASDRDGEVGRGMPHFVCADACNLPFKSATFDGCLSSHVLEHVETREALFEQARVTSVGGLIAAIVPDVRFTGGSDPTHIREWSQSEFCDHFSSFSNGIACSLRASGVARENYSFFVVFVRER